MQFSSSEIGHAAQICTKAFEVGLGATLASNQSFDLFKEIGQYINIVYLLGGIGATILLFFIYTNMIREKSEFIKDLRETLYSFKIRKITGTEEAVQEKVAWKVVVQEEVTPKQLRIYIAVPILFIVIAELLIFFGEVEIAVWVHIGVLLALSLFNIFIKDPKVHKVHLALMLLPVLTIVNLSIPIFFKITLYTFVLNYTPLAIPVAAMIIHQHNSLKEIGINKKHLLIYLVLVVPLSFMLAVGEYLTLRTGALIPDLSFKNLLMLTFIMVFFVGLVEELIFRSIIQTRLEQALSLTETLLITSFLFGLMHSGGTYYGMINTCFIGLIIGLIFYKTRSLPFVAVLHGFINVFLFGILPLHMISWI
jgi:membrane protease YdiL (CAAX protease family)